MSLREHIGCKEAPILTDGPIAARIRMETADTGFGLMKEIKIKSLLHHSYA
jgi:hypothetical protein